MQTTSLLLITPGYLRAGLEWNEKGIVVSAMTSKGKHHNYLADDQ